MLISSNYPHENKYLTKRSTLQKGQVPLTKLIVLAVFCVTVGFSLLKVCWETFGTQWIDTMGMDCDIFLPANLALKCSLCQVGN